MPDVISHQVESFFALGEPLADGVHFSTGNVTVAVSRQETIDSWIEQRQKPPRHWEKWPVNIDQLHYPGDVAQINKRVGIKELAQSEVSHLVAVFECRVDSHYPTFFKFK